MQIKPVMKNCKKCGIEIPKEPMWKKICLDCWKVSKGITTPINYQGDRNYDDGGESAFNARMERGIREQEQWRERNL